MAARTATNANYEVLANEAGIYAPTAKQWLSVMVSSGSVVLIKAPRMYFLDTGLCAYNTLEQS